MAEEYSLKVKAELDTSSLNLLNPGGNSPGSNIPKSPQFNAFAREMQQFAATMKQSMNSMLEFRKALNSAAFQLRNLGKGSIQGGNLPTITRKSTDLDVSRLNNSIAGLQNSINGMQTLLKKLYSDSMTAKSMPVPQYAASRGGYIPPMVYNQAGGNIVGNVAEMIKAKILSNLNGFRRNPNNNIEDRQLANSVYNNRLLKNNVQRFNDIMGYNIEYKNRPIKYTYNAIRDAARSSSQFKADWNYFKKLRRAYPMMISDPVQFAYMTDQTAHFANQLRSGGSGRNEGSGRASNRGAGIDGNLKRMMTYFAGDMIFNRMAQAENPYVSIIGKTGSTAMQGAFVGAGVGSVVPGIGTGIGAAIGGVVAGLTELISSFSDYSDKIKEEAEKFAEAAKNYKEAALGKAADIKLENRILEIPKLSNEELAKRTAASDENTAKEKESRDLAAENIEKEIKRLEEEREKKKTRIEVHSPQIMLSSAGAYVYNVGEPYSRPETEEEALEADKELAEKTKQLRDSLEKLDKSYQDSKRENDALNAELKKRQEALKKEQEAQEKRNQHYEDVKFNRAVDDYRESIEYFTEEGVNDSILSATARKDNATQNINRLLEKENPTEDDIAALTEWQNLENVNKGDIQLLKNLKKQFEAIRKQTDIDLKYLDSENTTREDSKTIKTAFKVGDWQSLNDKAKSVRDLSTVAWKEMQAALKQISRDDLNVEEKTAWQNEFDRQKEMYVDSKNRSENFTDSAIAILLDAMSKVVAPDMNNVNSLAAQGFMTSASDDQERLKEQTDYLKRLADITEQIRILEQERDNSATYE